jgi:hypothetical protein
MTTLASLNSFSSSNVVYQVDTQYVSGVEDDALIITPPSWAMIQTMGNILVSTGITATYTLANAASGNITFVTAAESPNVVVTSNVVTGVYSASNIHSTQDWLTSDASFNPPVDFFGNVSLTLTISSANSAGYTYSIPYNLSFAEKPFLIPAPNDVIYTVNANTVLNSTQVCQIGNEAPLSNSYTFTIDTQDPFNAVRLFTTSNTTLTVNTFTAVSANVGRLSLAGTGTNINAHLNSLVVQQSGAQRNPVIVNPSPSNLPLAPGYFDNAFSMAGYNSLSTTSTTVLNLLKNYQVTPAELTFEAYLNISYAVFLDDPTYGLNYFNQILGSGGGGGGGPLILRVLGPLNYYNTTGKTILALQGQQLLWYEFAFNTPMHVAITRTTDNLLRLYINGQQIFNTIVPPGQPTPAAGTIESDSANPAFFAMGHFSDNSTYPNGLYGYIDEIRLSNIIRYTGNFTKPAVSFLNDANTVMLLHQDTGAQDDGGAVTRSNAKIINAEDWRLTWTVGQPSTGITASYLQRYGQQRTGTFDLYPYTLDNTTTVTTANLRAPYHIGDVTETGNIMITAYSPLYYGNVASDQIDVTSTANSATQSTIQFVTASSNSTVTSNMARIRSRDATLAMPVPGDFTTRTAVNPATWGPAFYSNMNMTTQAFAVGGGQVDNFSGPVRWQYDDINGGYVAGSPFIDGGRKIRWYMFGTHSNYEYWSSMYTWVTSILLRPVAGGSTVWSWGRGGSFSGTWPAGRSLGIQLEKNFYDYPTIATNGVLSISRPFSGSALNFSADDYTFNAITAGVGFETSASGPGCYESAYSTILGAHAAMTTKPLFFVSVSQQPVSPAYTAEVTFGMFKYTGAGVRQVPLGGNPLLGYPSQLSFTQNFPV